MASSDAMADNVLLMLTEKCSGIDGLLDTFFSFLGRRTDFYTPPGGDDPNLHLEYCVKLVSQRCRQAGAAAIEAKRREAESKRQKEAAKPVVQADNSVIDVTSGDPDSVIEISRNAEPPEEVEEHSEGETDDSPPPGNGGTTEWYVWTQTLAGVEVSAPVPAGTKSRNIKVDISPNRMTAHLNGSVLFGGDLHETVRSDDCFWTLVDGKTLQITLEKLNQIQWWPCVIKGHPEIDVKKIVPENSKLGDLDPETRQTVEKMMFDQRQKAAGLPTSAQASQFEALERFKKAHPELDFSKANINFSS
ncbi:nuclear movement family protein, putative [Babesia ovata]|uniref:Nuclear migration protein nudC n=1 Tax=Babesia ovata TaxID=189622 RepID=A0A2H6K913_9APIC|nr:nuclear movement family protein, putative [Babesia ovata]GBE59439.1 nuclear movement family protein, putative [Babesia ovata]